MRFHAAVVYKLVQADVTPVCPFRMYTFMNLQLASRLKFHQARIAAKQFLPRTPVRNQQRQTVRQIIVER